MLALHVGVFSAFVVGELLPVIEDGIAPLAAERFLPFLHCFSFFFLGIFLKMALPVSPHLFLNIEPFITKIATKF